MESLVNFVYCNYLHHCNAFTFSVKASYKTNITKYIILNKRITYQKVFKNLRSMYQTCICFFFESLVTKFTGTLCTATMHCTLFSLIVLNSLWLHVCKVRWCLGGWALSRICVWTMQIFGTGFGWREEPMVWVEELVGGIQGDQLNMALFFCHIKKKGLIQCTLLYTSALEVTFCKVPEK